MKMNEVQQKVVGLIDRNELIELALTLGNIPSPAGEEAEIGNFIYDWLARNEYSPRRIGFVPERSCMAGVLPGTGDGISLAFNSHMDTAKQVDDVVRQLPESGGRAAWVDGKYIMGAGIVNDKGPMAAWMIAANAIRKAGVQLRGDLVLTMVPGEIDQEPVDEFTSPRYLSKEVGARYMITRGVVADCALVAEGTHFKVTWAGAGKACFKITVFGKVLYVPFLPSRGELTESPNAIVKTAAVIAGLEDWARDYERDGVVDTPGGRFVPKANIGALRAGIPSHISTSSGACHLYIDVRLAPGADPLAIRADLRGVLAKCGVEGKVELYTFRKAQVANDMIAPLAEAVGETHAALGYEQPLLADAIYSSMWRDHIAFIEAGIPALTYGPGAATAAGSKLGLLLDDLDRAARSYALIALNMCMREKKAPRKAATRDR
jgi:acetylornithine deacetylase/succinyl-diaminopimelate desuccinylase-like protein